MKSKIGVDVDKEGYTSQGSDNRRIDLGLILPPGLDDATKPSGANTSKVGVVPPLLSKPDAGQQLDPKAFTPRRALAKK